MIDRNMLDKLKDHAERAYKGPYSISPSLNSLNYKQLNCPEHYGMAEFVYNIDTGNEKIQNKVRNTLSMFVLLDANTVIELIGLAKIGIQHTEEII